MEVAFQQAPLPARYQPLVYVFAAFCLGIVADRFFMQSPVLWLVFASSTWLVWLLLRSARRDAFASTVLMLTIVMAAAAWHHVRWNAFSSNDIGIFAEEESQPICFEAVAVNAPRRIPAPPHDTMNSLPQDDQTEVLLQVKSLRNGLTWQAVSGRANMRVEGHLLGVRSGDRIRVFGLISRPGTPRNPGEFDFQRFLRTRGQLCSIRATHPACVTMLAQGTNASPRRLLNDLRQHCDQWLWKNINRERAGLAAAVLLGAREQVDRQRNEDFFTTGTVHLLAISGLHVGMLAYMCWMLARTGLVPRHWAILTTMTFVILYACLTDSRPPVVRATILVVGVCAAKFLGRQALSFNTIAAAGIIVLCINPAQLFQAGTQLSFLAVATLACCAPLLMPKTTSDPLDRLISNTRPWPVQFAFHFMDAVRRLWLTSALIWIVALPLVLYHFHLVSPAAVLLNPLLMVPIACVLALGFAVLTIGWLIPPIGWLFGWLCDKSLWLIEYLIEITRPVYGSHFFLPCPPAWWVVAFYVVLGLFVAFPAHCPPIHWRVTAMLVWIAVGLVTAGKVSSNETDRQSLHCTFLAVGHGTSVVLELPNGQTILYDAGHLGSPRATSAAITGYLWSRGKTHLDAVIVSHADLDHYNAVPELLERVSVGVVYVSPLMFEKDTPALTTLKRSIENANVPIHEISMGDRLAAGSGVTLNILHPPKRGVIGSDSNNENSIVLQIDFEGRRILLPGDLEDRGMQGVLAERPLHCDVVMAPHHGSAGSDPIGFAAWSTPEWVVISSGHGRELEMTKSAFEHHGGTVLNTADDGAVRVAIADGSLDVHAWRKNPP